MDLKRDGKIRAIGSSNVTPQNVEEYLACGCEIDIIQKKYSMFERIVETTLLPICEKHGISFHAYSPLERGLLTGTVKKDYTFGEKDARAGQPFWEPDKMPIAIDFVAGLKNYCEKYNCTQTELAIAFLRSQKDYVNVICGAHKPEQIEADVGAADVCISHEDLTDIHGLLEELDRKIAG